mgnify:CR=1 FL=1
MHVGLDKEFCRKMQTIKISPKQTEMGNLTISYPNGFPVLYCGRGSYIEEAKIWTLASVDSNNETLLIYIGKYCSIANNLQIYCDFNHDYRSIYQGLIPEYRDDREGSSFRMSSGQNYKYSDRKGMVVIGSDVWIGNDVSIISDVVIGNGAVIAAGSVVSHDIPAYTIWGGNPARKIKDRFSPDIAKKLSNIRWWDFPPAKLLELKEDMQGGVEEFVKNYWVESKDKSVNRIPVILEFIDCSTNYATFGKVLEEFIEKLDDKNIILRLVYLEDDETDKSIIPTVKKTIKDFECKSVELVGINSNEEESVIENADFFLIGRDVRNIERLEA